MLEPFVQKAFDKIKDASLAPVYLEQLSLLEKHIAFLSDRLATTEKDMAKTEGKLEAQLTELENLRSQLAAFDGKAKCIEIGPCFIKQAPSGQRLDGVYCPHCQSLMTKGQYTSYSEEFSYMCCKDKCHFEVPAYAVELALTTFHM